MSKKSSVFDCPDGKPLDGKLIPSIQFSDECLEDLFHLSFVFNVNVSDLIVDAIKLYMLSFRSFNKRICDAVGSVDSYDIDLVLEHSHVKS